MTTFHSTFVSTLTLALLLLTGFAITTNAQEQLDLSGATDASYDLDVRTSGDCDDNDERCAPSDAHSISVTKELDKATPAAPDTNVCDGVTCPDGSCAATSDQCTATAVNPDYLDPDDDGDGLDDSVERAIREGGQTIDAGTIPERSRVQTDVDGDGLDDGAGRAQSHNSSRSNRTEGVANDDMDSDGDGFGDEEMEPVQDYNATRSNKPSRAVFSDTDADGRPEVSMRGGTFVEVDNEGNETNVRAGGGAGGHVYCWGRAEDDEGTMYAWGRGICIAGVATENASEQAQNQLAALQVRGDDVRGWSATERAAWQNYRQARATTSPEEELVAAMVEKTQSNERIQEITSDDESIEMRYRTELRLFGIIPIQRDVAAQASADGAVTVDYPWYRFLSRVPEQATIQSTLNELQALLQSKRLDKASPKLAE